MKHFFHVFLLLFAGLTHAESVNWDAAYGTCSSEASAYDAMGRAAAANGFGQSTAQRNREFETAWFTRRGGPTAANVRERLADHEEILREHRGGIREESYYLNTCVLKAAIRQLESGATRVTQKAPPPAANPSAGDTDVNQSIALAQQNQAKGDEQARKDKRRRNYPELEASSCLTPDISRPGFSGFKNNCPFPVRYTYCVVSPERGTGAAFVDCSKQSGAGTVPANGEDFAHMKGGEQVHHVACKLPGTAITRKFENGRLWADCAKLGGD